MKSIGNLALRNKKAWNRLCGLNVFISGHGIAFYLFLLYFQKNNELKERMGENFVNSLKLVVAYVFFFSLLYMYITM